MPLGTLPFMSRPHAWLELRVWALMALPMGILASGVTGVLVNTIFAGRVDDFALPLAVALVSGAGPLANVGSVLWSHWSRGKEKIAALTRLQAAFGACLVVVAAVPLNDVGLAVLVTAVLCAQNLWCGIITIRASIWQLNYSRIARTAFAARHQVIVSVVMSAVGAGAGWVLDLNPEGFRWLFILTGVSAFASLAQSRGIRLRRQRQALAAEQRDAGRSFQPRLFWAILRDDHLYRDYMIWMMVFGAGNMMLVAPLVLVLTNNLGVSTFEQVVIAAALPTLVMPFATPFWARVLATQHVITFRSNNSRWYVMASLLILFGAVLPSMWLLWIGSVLLGIGVAGGSLGWNLGHNDFAPDDRAPEYLGLHVSLTGLRGLVAPLAGVACYGALERWRPGAGTWALAMPLLLQTVGALGFARMGRKLRRHSS
jgi:hypothetical protein